VKRFSVFKKELINLTRVGRTKESRQPRGIWTPAEDIFCIQAHTIKGKTAQIMQKYMRRFPHTSQGKTFDQIRSRGRVLQKQKEVKDKADKADKQCIGPKRKGQLRMFGGNHLNLIMDMLTHELIARLEEQFRSPTERELTLYASLMAVLPTLLHQDLRDEASFYSAQAEDVHSEEEVAPSEPEYKRLRRNSYTAVQNRWLTWAVKIAIPGPKGKISWRAIRTAWMSTFSDPDDIRSADQLRERHARLRRMEEPLETTLPNSLAEALAGETLESDSFRAAPSPRQVLQNYVVGESDVASVPCRKRTYAYCGQSEGGVVTADATGTGAVEGGGVVPLRKSVRAKRTGSVAGSE
jgi:hypothetical protein